MECTIDPEEHDDPRRLRAVGVHLLEKVASKGGHTLLGIDSVHGLAEELPATRPVPLDATTVKLCKDEFSEEIAVINALGVGGLALQLKRYTDYGSIIRRAVADRVTGKVTPAKVDWAEKLEKAFGPLKKGDKEEEKARSEKAFALDVLANSRLSVLIGPAGTGKTNFSNRRKSSARAWHYLPRPARRASYVANGEIGVVVGDAFKANSKPNWTKVQFASQPTFTYSFSGRDFTEEGSPTLELAYAVTVHKAQGSEFGKVFLVLPARSRLLSRRMLYTALARQMDRVVILHQGDLAYLRALRSPFFSEVARRLRTCSRRQR